MDYKTLNDNELLYLCSENNEEAINLIIDKYKNCILSILKDYSKEYNIIGLEIADLYQEGLIGLINAINTFDKNRDITFYTYANVCIKNNLFSAIRQSFRMKNRILNNSLSLDKIMENTDLSYYEIFKDEENDPNIVLMNKEERTEAINEIKSKLSENEKIIFELKLKGLSNSEIAELLDKDKKHIENALSRISKKFNNKNN